MPSIARAIRICEYLIEIHDKKANDLEKLVRDTMDPTKDVGSMGMAIADTYRSVVEALTLLRSELELPKKKTKCRHPKKMLDTCAGIVYCMNCNEDVKKSLISPKQNNTNVS